MPYYARCGALLVNPAFAGLADAPADAAFRAGSGAPWGISDPRTIEHWGLCSW